jgi:Protein kinase domain
VGHPPVLAGRYALVAPLGRGGMGQVWEGRDQQLGRSVAVKLLTADALAGQAKPESLVQRFTREAAVTAGLTHPCVPVIYDAGEHDGALFLVMELVNGCTVGDLIAEHGPLPVPWVVAIGAQVASVLAVAHDCGIIHRDIKPANVMLTADAEAKVLDFGVAGLLDQRITTTGAAIGTLAYMAPEQLHNLPPTPRTDLYALGCLLYEMLAGEPVFAASSPAGLMRLHLDAVPPPLSRADLPQVLNMLVRQLLEKDPARRPVDARETLDRLLPYVVPPGPLGDVDPAAGLRTGTGAYTLVMARLRGTMSASAGGYPSSTRLPAATWQAPAATWQAPAATWQALPAAARGRTPGWTVRHSLWLVPTLFFGLGTWLSFGYIAARHRRASWAIAAVAYLVLAVTAFILLGTAPDTGNGPLPVQADVALPIGMVVWLGGIVHALWVNFTVRLDLEAVSS